MNLLVRRIAVLSVVWAMCEVLLPEGKQRQLVRMTAGLLVMAALLSTVQEWLHGVQPAQQTLAQQLQQTSEADYRRTALVAAANQLEDYCVRLAERAGYQAEACIYLSLDGGLDHIELKLISDGRALVSPQKVKAALGEMLSVDEACIWLSVEAL